MIIFGDMYLKYSIVQVWFSGFGSKKQLIFVYLSNREQNHKYVKKLVRKFLVGKGWGLPMRFRQQCKIVCICYMNILPMYAKFKYFGPCSIYLGVVLTDKIIKNNFGFT